MLFAGFSVSKGELTLFGIVARRACSATWSAPGSPTRSATTAALDLLEKNKLIHISPRHLKWADDWFERYGDATVFFSRMLPIVRTFISLPAGVAKMPFWRFTALHRCSARIPWVLVLALIGEAVGDNWEEWRHHLSYLDYVVVAAIVGGDRLPADRGGAAAGPASEPRPAEPAGAERRLSERPTAIPAGARWRSGSSRARPSCCRSPAPPTSSSSPGSRAGTGTSVDPEVRKSFEVALHAGAAAALLIGQRRLIAEELRALRRAAGRCCSASPSCPAAVVGYTLERPIERRLGGPRATAYGLLAGAAAMLVADRRPQRRGRGEAGAGRRAGARRRPGGGAGARASPATASPSPPPAGARFSRDQANLLSRTIALPIIVGATALKGVRLRRRGASPRAAPLAGDRRRRLLRLDPRLAAADPAGRARPRALALRRLPGRPRRRRSCEAGREASDASDAYAQAGVDQGAADSAVAGLVGRWARSSSGGPRGRCRCPATTRA